MSRTLKITTISFLLSIQLHTSFAQDAPFFSITGDTIAYFSLFGQTDNEDKIQHTCFIKAKSTDNKSHTISSFQLNCDASNKCRNNIQKDTLKKYCLEDDGTTALFNNNDFTVTISSDNTMLIDTSTFGKKYIYSTKLTVFIGCNQQELYSKTLNVQFKGDFPKDVPVNDIVRIKAWRKTNTRKYFVTLSVKEKQTYKKPGDTEYSEFKNYEFML